FVDEEEEVVENSGAADVLHRERVGPLLQRSLGIELPGDGVREVHVAEGAAGRERRRRRDLADAIGELWIERKDLLPDRLRAGGVEVVVEGDQNEHRIARAR